MMSTMLPGTTGTWVWNAVYALSPEPSPAAQSAWDRDTGFDTERQKQKNHDSGRYNIMTTLFALHLMVYGSKSYGCLL